MKYFKLSEFACKCGKCKHVEPPKKLQLLVDAIREKVGYPIIITSGYRCPAHNAAVGGAKNSVHMNGYAADLHIYAPNATANERKALTKKLQEVADELNTDGGVGFYSWGVHVDVRGRRVRW